MKQNDTMSTLERLAERLGFYMSAPFKGQHKQVIERLYTAALRRDWALFLLLMDCLCSRTRELAFLRFVRRLRFRSEYSQKKVNAFYCDHSLTIVAHDVPQIKSYLFSKDQNSDLTAINVFLHF